MDHYNDIYYQNGIQIILECYNECEKFDGGNSDTTRSKFSHISDILSKIFENKISWTRLCKMLIRSVSGAAADIISLGIGGDVIINSIFSIISSSKFIKNIKLFIDEIHGVYSLFNKLVVIDRSKIIPVASKLNLDEGIQEFEQKFVNIINDYIKVSGTRLLDKVNELIIKIINKIKITISDWIACLFPDTVGLAGEIALNFLNYITENGFTFIYNLISLIPNRFQYMITDKYALKNLIVKAVKIFRKLIMNAGPDEIAQVIRTIGKQGSDFINNSIGKTIVKTTTSSTATVIKYLGKTGYYQTKLINKLPIPTMQKILVKIINTFILPYIGYGVELFDQLLPLFLMFTLFTEKFTFSQKQIL